MPSDRRRVGVVAATLPKARDVIDALGLQQAIPLSSRRGAGGRGLTLRALVIDETALPLTEERYSELLPSLLPDSCGHVYELRRLS